LKHFASRKFWKCHDALPKETKALADRCFRMLKDNPKHPSLHLKRIEGQGRLWSVRVGLDYRAVGLETPEGIVWLWIGVHSDYELIIRLQRWPGA